MSLVCQCPSCKAKYQLGDQYAGRKIKCPKCSAVVLVPAAIAPGEPAAEANAKPSADAAPAPARPKTQALAAEKAAAGDKTLPTAKLVASAPPRRAAVLEPAALEPVARPAKAVGTPQKPVELKEAAEAGEEAAEAPAPDEPALEDSLPEETTEEETVLAQGGGEDDDLGFLSEPGLSSKQIASRPAKKRPAVSDRAAVTPDVTVKPVMGSHPAKPGKAPHAKKKRQAAPKWMIAAIAGGGVAIAAMIGAAFYFYGGARSQAAAADNGKQTGVPAVDPKVPQLNFVFDWPESERVGATLKINGDVKEFAAHGPISLKLPLVDKPYSFVLERQGYKPIKFSRRVVTDDQQIVAGWESDAPAGIAWEQDFNAAKREAAEKHKNLFILFDASDTQASRFASERFASSIAAQKDFADRCEREYVLVYIDNPEGDAAKKRVKDLARNRDLTKSFRIGVFPTVVVADARARPFGIMRDYKINGVNAFLELMDQWQEDRKRLFAMLDQIEAHKENPDPGVLRSAIDFLTANELDQIYRATIRRWREKLPQGAAPEASEADARLWEAKLFMCLRNPDSVHDTVAAFDRWKAEHSLKKHPDAGAALDALAALALARIGDKEGAKKKCEEGFALEPKDPRVFGMLSQVQEALTGRAGERPPLPVGSGTGFCIAAGNYVMTNHHVIKEAKKIMVHLNGKAPKYSAHLVADNEEGDMAVLKVDLPDDVKLRPIPLAETDAGIGDEVCAFGFPGLLAENLSSTLTNGLISTVHDSDGLLVTNCKIEHGNSGGPLCGVANCCIAGMVTAKTAQVHGLSESYGLAIPASHLKKFLLEKLPADVKSQLPPPSNVAAAKLSDVVKRVQGSVVYVENYQ